MRTSFKPSAASKRPLCRLGGEACSGKQAKEPPRAQVGPSKKPCLQAFYDDLPSRSSFEEAYGVRMGVAARSARDRATIAPAHAIKAAAVTSVTVIPVAREIAASTNPATTSPTYSA
jgi:hypothetical protein